MLLKLLLSTVFISLSSIAVPMVAVSQSDPPQRSASEFSIARMGVGGVMLGMKASQVERKLGKPPQMASQMSMCCGTLLSWTYPELEVRFEVPEGIRQEPNASVYSVSTRSAKYMTPEGIRVGDRRSKVLRTYGTPTNDENNSLFYSNNEYASSLVFQFENDRVVQISAAMQLN